MSRPRIWDVRPADDGNQVVTVEGGHGGYRRRQMADDLLAFLRARLDEDQDLSLHEIACDTNQTYDYGIRSGRCDCGWPARWVREVETKRQVVERCQHVLAAFDDPVSGLWPNVNRREKSHAHTTLCLLAAPYANHPDYREEWRPE